MKVHPARMKWIIKRLSILTAVFALFLLVVAAVKYRKKSIVSEDGLKISVINNKAGNKFIEPDDVVEILFENFRHGIVGQALEIIDIEETEKVLENNMFIKDADVYIDALNRVHITIEQSLPIVRVICTDASSFYLDNYFNKVQTTSKFTARVPVLTGKVFNPSNKERFDHHMNRMLKLIDYLHRSEFWNAQIEQIHVDKKGMVQLIPKIGDQVIIFGDPQLDIEDKLDRLSVFYKEALPIEGWNKYKSINLSFKGQVVAQKR